MYKCLCNGRLSLSLLCIAALLTLGEPPTHAQTKQKAKPTKTQPKATKPQRKNTKSTNKKSTGSTEQISTLKKEQQALNKRIATNEKQLKHTQQQVRTQLHNLKQLDSEINKQDAVIKQVANEVSMVNKQVTMLDSSRIQLQDELNAIKLRYQRSLLYMTRHRTAVNKLLFVFSAKDFSQMYRRMKYMNLYARYQQAQGEMVRRKEEELRGVQQRLQETQQTKQSLLNQEQHAKTALQKQQTERQGIVAKLQSQQKTLQSVLDTDRKKYNQLNTRIDQLVAAQIAAAERARKAAEAARQKQAAKVHSKATKTSNNKKQVGSNAPKPTHNKNIATSKVYAADADVKLSSNFAANKGSLPAPITSSYRITSHFGANAVQGLSGVTLDNKGINLTASTPAQARAVFDGEVSAIFSIGGQMNVLVRHGSYISVYCNLSSVTVRQGQKVSTRQTLGHVSSDGQGSYTLHFQLRKETTKLNPSAWIR